MAVNIKNSNFESSKQFVLDYIRDHPTAIDEEAYELALEKMVNSLEDDHSQIEFKSGTESDEPDFAQFIADAEFTQDGELKLFITFTCSPSIKTGDEILKINQEDAKSFLDRKIETFESKTTSYELNMKRAAANISSFNPFETINNITVLRNKKTVNINLKYTKAIPALFLQNGANFEGFVKNELLRAKYKNKVGVSLYDYAKLIHIEIHDFPMYGNSLAKILGGLKIAKYSDQVDWVLLDFRQNFGGSPIGLFFIVEMLMDKSLLKYISGCRQNIYSVSDEFLAEYREQFVQPILEDSSTDPETKKFFTKELKYFKTKGSENEKLHVETEEKCGISDTTKTIKKIATDLLNQKGRFKKMVVVTDYHCFSACVWSVNFLSIFPNVLLVGKEVGSTTGSGNSLNFMLPSRMASVYLPQMATNIVGKMNKKILNKKTEPDIYLEDSVVENTKSLLIWFLENKNLLDHHFINKAKQAIA